MKGSPLINFIYVLIILTVMGAGVYYVAKPKHSAQTAAPAQLPSEDNIRTEVIMTFSHQPLTVKVQGIDNMPRTIDQQLTFELMVPENTKTDLLLDIAWRQSHKARYFTDIIIRQDGKKDQQTIFTDQPAEFSDILTIDTRRNDEHL